MKFILIALFVTSLLSLSCTREKDKTVKLRITTPSGITSQQVSTQQFNNAIPAGLEEINCYAIMISHPLRNESFCNVEDMSKTIIQRDRPFFDLIGFFGENVVSSIAVPSAAGETGTVYILGTKSINGNCEFHKAITDEANYSEPLEIGSAEFDLSPKDTPIDVRVDLRFDSANLKKLGQCHGPNAPDGGDECTAGNCDTPSTNDFYYSQIPYGEPLYLFAGHTQNFAPTVSGDAPTSWAISPALSNGLIFDTTNGQITGTVGTSYALEQDYTVTATYADNSTLSDVITLEFPKHFVVDTDAMTADSNPGDGVCDDGASNCTLTAAFEEANHNSNFDNVHILLEDNNPSPRTYTIPSRITISNSNGVDVHVVGKESGGTYTTLLDGSNTQAFFQVVGNNSLYLVNLEMQNAFDSSNGGSVVVHSSGGDLVIGNSYIHDCTSTAGAGGGAIRMNGNGSGAYLNIHSTRIENCYTTSASGGAINSNNNDMSIDIEKSIFSGNHANAQSGGAINMFGSNTSLNIDSTEFTGNYTLGTGYGGGAIQFNGAHLNIENSTFNSNYASGTSFGGALYLNMNAHASSDWTLENVSFYQNNGTSSGGAIFDMTSSNPGYIIEIVNSAFIQNTSGSGSGSGAAIQAPTDSNIQIGNTYFDNNSGSSSCSVNGTFTSLDYNIGTTGDATCNPTGGTMDDFTYNANDLFDSIQPHGHLNVPEPKTVLHDAGDQDLCPYFDIRGFKRPDDKCAVGPFDPNGYIE